MTAMRARDKRSEGERESERERGGRRKEGGRETKREKRDRIAGDEGKAEVGN